MKNLKEVDAQSLVIMDEVIPVTVTVAPSDCPELLPRTQWPHMAWPLATSWASFPPRLPLLISPPLKRSSLTSLLKCHIIRKAFPGHSI